MTYTSDSRAIRQLTLDSARALANKSGRVGFAILVDSNNPESFDIVPLGDATANVRGFTPEELAVWNNPGPTPKRVEEGNEPTKLTGNAKMAVDPYETMAPGNFQRAAAQSHRVAEAAGETKTQKTGDAALLRAKQTADAAREKINRLAAYERNERIAKAMKAESDKMWKRSA